MFEQLKYINHMGEVYEFGHDGIYVNMNDLRDYEWNVLKQGERIGGFDRKITKKKLPVVILQKSVEAERAAQNKLYEVTEKDVIAEKYGKVVIGDYYMRGYITKSQKSDYMRLGRYVSYTLTLTTDFPVWIKETKHVFRKTSASAGGKNLDYPFDFPFDFKSTIGSSQFNNASIAASNFRMIIYGACVDPEIKIGGHVYKVNGKVEANEYLTIDSVTREIYLTKNDGTRVNRFDDRYRRSYIFEPIPAGIAYVSWEGDFGLDLILYDERSEPKWI